MNRRTAIQQLGLGALATSLPAKLFEQSFLQDSPLDTAIVLSTWYNQGVAANSKAWDIIANHGDAIDAVEQGVMIVEQDGHNCCVGLSGYPDREGIVTLDASIMNHKSECGSVACIEGIAHPIAVARKVMEASPHVMLVGLGAQQFAIQQGFELLPNILSEEADKAYRTWLKKSEYKPIMNIEKQAGKGGPSAPHYFDNGVLNHDTIGMIALDTKGNLSGACTTSGMGFKLHGRVGDSPIIGAGLYVDNEVGAATATGHGEEVIRISGSFLVVEYMRQGYSPAMACKKAVERIKQKSPKNLQDIQVGFIAINTEGDYGGYCLHKGFDYCVSTSQLKHEKEEPKFLI